MCTHTLGAARIMHVHPYPVACSNHKPWTLDPACLDPHLWPVGPTQEHVHVAASDSKGADGHNALHGGGHRDHLERAVTQGV